METQDIEKVDFKKLYAFYKAGQNSEFVAIPSMNYLQIDGHGDPNSSKDFQDAIEALFSVAYTLKFMVKKGPAAVDYGVLPLEALWWAPDMNDFLLGNKEKWLWTAMIMQPHLITSELYEEAKKAAAVKKELPALTRMRFAPLDEDNCAQILHTGPYAAEAPTIKRLHDFIGDNGFRPAGKHHEIYLNDMRKTAPDRLKTIIRQPVVKAI